MFPVCLPCAHAPILCSVIIILPALSILPGLRAEGVLMLEGDNGCQKPAVRAAVNCKAAGSWGWANYEAGTAKLVGIQARGAQFIQRQTGASFECQQVTCEQESHEALDSFIVLAYRVLHVMPPHLTNTHGCCYQAALDKKNMLTCCSGWFQGLDFWRVQAGNSFSQKSRSSYGSTGY